MKLATKLCVLGLVAAGVAAAEAAVGVVDPSISQEAALAQFDDGAASDRVMRGYAQGRRELEELLWLAVPLAAAALFAGDVTRLLSGRKSSG